MSHELEVDEQGRGSFFSHAETPWHGLGVVVPNALTAEEAMKAARLDWEVEKHPIQAVIVDDSGASTVDIENRYATARRSPFTGEWEVLGVVGEIYTVIQNVDNAVFLNALVNESGANIETAGSLRGGRRVFVTMKLPRDVKVNGVDPIDMYLVATNSHDGSTAFTVAITPVRVVCANTLNYALKNTPNIVRIRHTTNAMEAIQEVRKTLGITSAYIEEFAAMCEQLQSVPLAVPRFERIVDKLWTPTTNKAGEPTLTTSKRRLELVQLFTGAEEQDFGRGTCWGGLNAVTQYLDHTAPIRKGGRDHATQVAEGSLDEIKTKALNVFARVR